MEKHLVKVLETGFVTHNVKRFKVEKPAGYTYVSGQATDVSINKPGLEDELRPFTFTSVNTDDHLEFTIKIYKGNNGITEKLADIIAGDELIIHEVFGAIAYHQPGLFIAGGAGITPFISILRQLKIDGKLAGNVQLFANHSPADIILKDELTELLGENFINVIKVPDGKIIDKTMLSTYAGKFANYYVCGPDKFTTDMIDSLKGLGVAEEQIIFEH
ncbi:FAD-binding oxidoreductase [Mucilaginibacter flavidus]|uniref:FAD-binding oxidoreductase n=1 Tax=Mucilaginibacter flavidus TaxID=2949309 RepID=UPI0020933BA9|nr:FAD-binding oxidoreductase [Mucilaginibacter flavidus]MCO5947029.1 FAD-binding oxidoreductase [Mucilaginibacter flavidus]